MSQEQTVSSVCARFQSSKYLLQSDYLLSVFLGDINRPQYPDMKYKVRFKAQVDSRSYALPPTTAVPWSECTASTVPVSEAQVGQQGHLSKGKGKGNTKSRHGCKECKSRKVKCDDTYPVCLRCQRRGSVCHPSAPPPMQWQIEMPGILMRTPTESWIGAVKPHNALLRYWLDNSCRMLSLTPDDNPFSYPLIEHLLYTPSLVHAVQSVGAGQMVFYDQSSLKNCLSERGLAIKALQQELRQPEQIRPASLLTVFLLGISASWAEEQPCYYGKEHISGARALLGMALVDMETRHDPLVRILLGWYLYWDMAISLVTGPDECLTGLPGLSELDLCAAIETSQASFHPMIGFSGKLFYLLAGLHRYCRQIIRGSLKDPDLEAQYEQQLLAWAPQHDDKTLVDASIAFRNHGLIVLYEICGRPFIRAAQPVADTDLDATRAIAYETLENLFKTPPDAPCIHSHSIPLLTAGAQLQCHENIMRVKVVERFQTLFSTNRLPVNLWAIQLLEELWSLGDSGNPISWLELLLSKNWTLNFA